MSMLDRYRKTGGFTQLLNLVETCDAAKREKFMDLIHAEDSRWANELQIKMLNTDRVFSWGDDYVAEVLVHVQDLTLAIVIQSSAPELKERLINLIPVSRRRKVEAMFKESVSSAEVSTSLVKIIEAVRKIAAEGILRFDKFDPDLSIDANIEEKLKNAPQEFSNDYLSLVPAPALKENSTTSSSTASESSAPFESLKNEIVVLKKRLMELGKENALLKTEVANYRSKLEQIKRIA